MTEQAAYKEMYLIMARAAEKAQRILIEAQRQCEELYLSAGEIEQESMPIEQTGGAGLLSLE